MGSSAGWGRTGRASVRFTPGIPKRWWSPKIDDVIVVECMHGQLALRPAAYRRAWLTT